MYSKVIVPLDGSELAEQSLPYVRLVARSFSVPIELVEAFDVLPPAVHGPSTTYARNRMLEEMRRRTRRYLAATADALNAEGYNCTSMAVQGVPSQAVVRHVSADPDALVVMSTHGRGGIARWALGSVADKVLNAAPNPILLVRSAAQPGPDDVDFQTVLVPLDGSELAELSLSHAAAIARACGADVSLLRLSPTAEYYRRHVIGPIVALSASGSEVDEFVSRELQAEAAEATGYLARVQHRLADEPFGVDRVATRHVQHDDYAQSIIDHAVPDRALVVMTSHGRTGMGRVLMGSVTDRVIRHSTLPVLVVRKR